MEKMQYLLEAEHLRPYVRRLRIVLDGPILLGSDEETFKKVARLVGTLPNLTELVIGKGSVRDSLSREESHQSSTWLEGASPRIPTCLVSAIGACATLQGLELSDIAMAAPWPPRFRPVAKPRRLMLRGAELGKVFRFLDVFATEHLSFDAVTFDPAHLLRPGARDITSLELDLSFLSGNRSLLESSHYKVPPLLPSRCAGLDVCCPGNCWTSHTARAEASSTAHALSERSCGASVADPSNVTNPHRQR